MMITTVVVSFRREAFFVKPSALTRCGRWTSNCLCDVCIRCDTNTTVSSPVDERKVSAGDG